MRMHLLPILILNLAVTTALGQSEFEEHVITSNALGATGVSAADLDGDGDTDVLSADLMCYVDDGAGNAVADIKTVVIEATCLQRYTSGGSPIANPEALQVVRTTFVTK